MRFGWTVAGMLALQLAAAPLYGAERYGENVEVGMTFYDLGQYDRALKYLEPAYQAKPGNEQVAVAYAAALVKVGRADEARAILEKFTSAEAAFQLGEAKKALGDNAGAREAYRKAAQSNGPLGPRALLEAGRMSSAVGDYAAAKTDFERVLQLQGAGDLINEAKNELANLESRRRFGFGAFLGVRYDTNVRLAQEPASGDRGLRTVVNLQGRYRLVNGARLRSDVAVSIDQGRYLAQNLRALDLGSEAVQADATYKLFSWPVRIGGQVEAAHQTLDFNNYGLGLGAGPRVLVAEGKAFATTAAWKWRKDNFALDARDGIERSAVVNQFVFWGKSGFAGIGGAYQMNRAVDMNYQYDVVTGRLFAGDEFGPGIAVDAGVDLSRTRYTQVERAERTTVASLGVGKYWGPAGVRVSEAFVVNQSDSKSGTGFDFRKNVVGFDVRYRY